MDQPSSSETHEGVAEAPGEPAGASRIRHPSSVGPSHHLRRWLLVTGGASVLVLVTAVLGFGLTRDPTFIGSPLIGKRAPDFELQFLDGDKSISSADLRGQVVVVNFWASWCGPCREEHPSLKAAWERYRDRGVVLVGIVYEDSPSAARAFMQELGGDWPILIDPGGKTALKYGVYGIPETFFIDTDGVIAYKKTGASSYGLLVAQIERLLSAASE